MEEGRLTEDTPGKVTVVDATTDHARDFLSRPIRQADLDEWAIASGGKPAWKSVAGMFADPHDGFFHPRAAVLDGRTLALWGVSKRHDEEIAYVWLIASVEAEERPRAVHAVWREEVAHLHEAAGSDFLVALVWERNELHVKWLRLLGFEKDGNMQVGPVTLGVWRRIRYVS